MTAFRSQLMDDAALSLWILRRLGAPQWKVELTQCNLDDAIASAKRWFAAKKGLMRLGGLSLVAGRPDYPLPDEVDAVISVSFERPEPDVSTIFSPFLLMDDEIPYDVFAAPQSVGLYSSFVQTLQYVDTAKRVLGADLDWRQHDRVLYISPTPGESRRVVYQYKTSVYAIDQLSEIDHDLIKRRALAFAKMDLGRVRSKYDSFQGANGSRNLDGERLLEEAQAEMEKLDEEIIELGKPMLFATG